MADKHTELEKFVDIIHPDEKQNYLNADIAANTKLRDYKQNREEQKNWLERLGKSREIKNLKQAQVRRDQLLKN